MRQAFATLPERNRQIRLRTGTDGIRLLFCSGQAAAALTWVGCGQFFGGRAVPAAFVAGVTVAPGFRGRGIGTEILRGLVNELRDRKVPLCTLYASNLPVYRGIGFEVAGTRIYYTASIATLTHRERDLDLLPLTSFFPPDRDLGEPAPLAPQWGAVTETYRRWAAEGAGLLDRGPFFWREKLAPLNRRIDTYLVGDPGSPEGYIATHHTKGDTLHIVDWCALSAAAGRTINDVVSRHRASWPHAHRYGWLADILCLLQHDRSWAVHAVEPWMTRIVDVEAALRSRGWPRDLTAVLDMRVRDPDVPANDAAFRLQIAQGEAVVERTVPVTGGDSAIEITVGALAALYTGHIGARALARTGLVRGEAGALILADGLFRGPPPVLMDTF